MKRILSLGFLFGMLAFALIPNAYASWDIEELDFGPHFAEWNPEHAMAYNVGTGNVYVAYGGNHLYVSRYNQGTGLWEGPVVVDPAPNVGRYTSCAFFLGSNDLHISYYDEENGDLKYAVYTDGTPFDASNFTVSTLDSDDNVGQYTSIDVGLHPTGPPAPRIAYYDATNRQLKFIYYDSSAGVLDWQDPIVVDSNGNVGKYTSMAIDPTNGNIHISYYDETNYDLKYAWTDDLPSFLNWTLEVADNSTSDVGKYSSIALNPPAGYPPVISYFDDTNNNMMFVYRSHVPSVPGSSWQTPVIVDSDVDVGRYCSLRIDSTGLAHISYYDATNDQLKYAVGSGDFTTGTITVLPTTGGTGGLYTSIILRPGAPFDPWISYYDETTFELRVMRWDTPTTSWIDDVVDVEEDLGQFSSLVVDGNTAHVAYYDAINRDLKYTRYQIDPPAAVPGYPETVVATGEVGAYCSLALDSAGNPRISYQDRTANFQLMYIAYDGAVWQTPETVDDGGLSMDDVGSYTSIAVDANNRAHISYYDETNNVLKYAYWNGSKWVIEVVDNNGDVGMFTSSHSNATRCKPTASQYLPFRTSATTTTHSEG